MNKIWRIIKLISTWTIGSLGFIIGIIVFSLEYNTSTWIQIISTVVFVLLSLIIIPIIHKRIRLVIPLWIITLLFFISLLGMILGNSIKNEVYIAIVDTGAGDDVHSTLILYDNYSYEEKFICPGFTSGGYNKGTYKINFDTIYFEQDNWSPYFYGKLTLNRINFYIYPPSDYGLIDKYEVVKVSEDFFSMIGKSVYPISNETNFTALNFSIDELTLKQKDTTDIDGDKYSWLGAYLVDEGCKLRIKLPDNYKILNIERRVVLYPTIWSDWNDDLDQFIRFKNLSYTTNKKIEYQNPYYDWDEIKMTKFLYNKFKDITKGDLEDGLKSEYADADVDCRNKWLAYINKYQRGDFLKASETFRIIPYEVYLVLTYKYEGNVYEKVFRTYIIIGN